MNAETEEQILNLWPTTFLHYSLDGHEQHNPALADLATDSPGADLLQSGDPAAAWLVGHVSQAAEAYLMRCAEAPVTAIRVVSRAVIHECGEYRPLGNHPDSYVSGIYHIAVPQDRRESHHRSDTDSNAISYYDPRFAMNMGAISGDPNFQMERCIRPTAGLLILWPSFVDFFVHPNLSATPQISLHFNIYLESGR